MVISILGENKAEKEFRNRLGGSEHLSLKSGDD